MFHFLSTDSDDKDIIDNKSNNTTSIGFLISIYLRLKLKTRRMHTITIFFYSTLRIAYLSLLITPRLRFCHEGASIIKFLIAPWGAMKLIDYFIILPFWIPKQFNYSCDMHIN